MPHFRLVGSSAQVQRLKEAFANNPTKVELADEKLWDDIHAICGLLKMYIRELSEPVLTAAAYTDFIGRQSWNLYR